MNETKCAHVQCGCPVGEGEKYCSAYCQDSGNLDELPCNCGHRGCVQQKMSAADRKSSNT